MLPTQEEALFWAEVEAETAGKAQSPPRAGKRRLYLQWLGWKDRNGGEREWSEGCPQSRKQSPQSERAAELRAVLCVGAPILVLFP